MAMVTPDYQQLVNQRPDFFTFEQWKQMLTTGYAPVVATADLPVGGAAMDGRILIEDGGAGDRNVIVYAGGQRFRIDGGTAFYDATTEAFDSVRAQKATDRINAVVLLTDGRNNRGQIDPLSGARLAQAMGVKVHTIGVGTEGEAPYPIDDPVLGRTTQVGVPIHLAGTPGAIQGPRPQPGRHNDEIFGELGYSAAEIAAFSGVS